MIPLPATPVEFAPDLTFRFPTSPCCNCSTPAGLELYSQDTRLTRYFLIGGREYKFRLQLPFCASCAPSSRRRPGNLLSSFLILVLCFSAVFGLLLVVALLSESEWLLEHMVPLSAFGAVPLFGARFLFRRAEAGQTSYCQPVRVRRVKTKLFSNTVTKIRFAFTNHQFAREFEFENRPALEAGVLEVRRI